MASALQTAQLLLKTLAGRQSASTETDRLLRLAGIGGKGPYARKVLNALATSSLIRKSRKLGTIHWSAAADELPSDILLRDALRPLRSNKKKPGMPSSTLPAPGPAPVIPGVGPDAAPRIKRMVSGYFEQARDLAKCRRPIMLVGPAGCGKTYLAGKVAEQLDMDFASISCSAGMSETHLLGRSIPNVTDGTSRFQSTDFLRCYENGGVFLLDEIDAADPNLLVMLNSGLANGYLSVPSRSEAPSAQMSPDFVIFASANTFGRGADRLYVGRAQLDEATIDRFRMGTIQMDYDKNVEATLCPDESLLDVCWQIRTKIESNKLRRLMSTRFIKDAYTMFNDADWSIQQIVNTFFQGWSVDEQSRCLPIIPSGKKAPAPPSSSTPPSGETGGEWNLPSLTIFQRRDLDDNNIKIQGVSSKQVDYAERIIAKWMTDNPLQALLDELKPISQKAGNDFAGRIIRWWKMKYVPGKDGNAPQD